ncbi:unnamed protein product [Protopolystoma xenopodis]|uniref:Uncharacterized protein n=1 Tax=Protopolystoma xenopodis TaxID=117903 RepID=A0A3S5FGU5_9PLAT|nr:unnamed protein product [Protopolystoma xenopodis]
MGQVKPMWPPANSSGHIQLFWSPSLQLQLCFASLDTRILSKLLSKIFLSAPPSSFCHSTPSLSLASSVPSNPISVFIVLCIITCLSRPANAPFYLIQELATPVNLQFLSTSEKYWVSRLALLRVDSGPGLEVGQPGLLVCEKKYVKGMITSREEGDQSRNGASNGLQTAHTRNEHRLHKTRTVLRLLGSLP